MSDRFVYMKLGSRKPRFWTSAKNIPLITKTPGGILIRGESFMIRAKGLHWWGGLLQPLDQHQRFLLHGVANHERLPLKSNFACSGR